MLIARLIILMIAALTVRSAALDLDSLLVKSVGGQESYEVLKTMTSYYAEGTVIINGNQGTFVEHFVPPQKLYLEVNLGAMKLVQAYDGQSGWQRDHNGSITALSGVERDELLEQIYFESYSYLFPERMIAQVKYRGDSVFENVPCHVVVMALPGADSVTAYFDTSSGERRFMTSRMDNMTVVTTISDYRDVEGVRIPFASRAIAIDAPITSEFHITQANFNDVVDTTIFQRPDVQTADFKFPDQQSEVRIPFEYRSGHIYVPVTLNGKKKLLFILDSGASANMLHEKAVVDLELPTIGSLPAKGLANYQEFKLVRVDSLAIGDLRLLNQVSGLIDLSGVGLNNQRTGEFGGILGYDFLSRFPIMLNYADSSLTVFNPSDFTPPEGGTEVPFHLTLQVPTVEVSVNGVAGEFIIDVGNAFGMILHKTFASRPEVAKKLHHVESLSAALGGVGGGVNGKTATVDSAVIGGQILLTDLRVITMESAGGLAGSERLAGNIGNLALQSFRILFDYSRQRLIFYPADTHP